MNNTVLTKEQSIAMKYAIVNGLDAAFNAASLEKKKEIGYKMEDLKDACFRVGLSDEFQELTAR